jgi:hypothetical protein
MHIPPHLILPQDMIDMVDRGPTDPGEPPGGDAEHLGWLAKKAEWDAHVAAGRPQPVIRMHVSDAKHAMDVDPARWGMKGFHDPEPAAPEPETNEQTGADGPAWYPQGNEIG